MTRNQREKDVPITKQEGSTSGEHKASQTSSSRLWLGLKMNPRIVRVSRGFGGKDRHSKVSTVRGLRDRRVRLSVPTAIQLYDLQDRLGLNQPSKVVDWLLNAAQHEIDKLPPLQFPPQGFIQFPSQSSTHHDALPLPQAPLSHPHLNNGKSFGYTNEHDNGEGLATSSFSQSTHDWNSGAPHQRSEQDPKEPFRDYKGNTLRKAGNGLASAQVVLSHEILQRPNHSSYYQWKDANAYSSQPDQAPVISIPSSRSLALESQIVFCPPGIMPSSMFPSSTVSTPPTDFNSKLLFGQLQMANSSTQTHQQDISNKL